MKQAFPRTLIAATLTALLIPAVALAQAPLPQHVISRGFTETRGPNSPAAPARSAKNGRLLYGRIETVRAALLVVQTRYGRTVRVDASDALRSGMYSAPLFVGKLVSITGYYDALHTLHAQSITRETRINAATGPDR